MNENITNTDLQTLKNRLKIEWTYTSNAIEGNTISLGDTAFIIEYGLTIKGKTVVEHTDIIGHAKAVDFIYELTTKDEIVKQDICTLHKVVQTQIIIDTECPVGVYKVVENGRYIKINGKLEHKYYPHPRHMNHLMGLWFQEFGNIGKKLTSFDDCVKIYTDMHIALSAIHPFFDGNGRIARLVANIPLIKNGFLPIIINNEDRQEYMELLSNHSITTKELDDTTTKLIEENDEYKKLFGFFKDQYKNSQILLDEIKRSKK